MRIGRTLPPAAAALDWIDVWRGIAAWRDRDAVRSLERDLARAFDVSDVFMLSSGTAALAVTFAALKSLSPRREVVMPAFTCFSVAAAVVSAGLRPVLCDIDPVTFDFDHERLMETVNERTLCVVTQHLFGMPAAVERIGHVCRRHGAFLVEDAAQAMGVAAGGRPLGTFGDAGILSFGRGKNVTCGSGGVVLTNVPAVAAAIASLSATLPSPSVCDQLRELVSVVLMLIFIRPSLYWIPASLPFLKLGETTYPTRIVVKRLSRFHAGLLRRWRHRLAASNRARAAAVNYFRRQLSLGENETETRPFVRLPFVVRDARARRRIYQRSRERGLGLAASYPTPISAIPEIAGAFEGQQFPAAQALSERLVTLPTHHWLSEHDKRAIADLFREVSAA